MPSIPPGMNANKVVAIASDVHNGTPLDAFRVPAAVLWMAHYERRLENEPAPSALALSVMVSALWKSAKLYS